MKLAWLSIPVVMASVTATADPLDRRCGTPGLLSQLADRPKLDLPRRGLTVAAKLTRDGFGGGFTQLLSTNFAVKWSDPTVTTTQARVVADALELAWAKYIGELGHDPCIGCVTYRLNAYIARASDSPGIDYAGGYAWIDDQGYPYFVISRDIFARPDGEQGIRAVAAHEFYHDIQFSTGAFAWDTTAYGWFWEATAEWAAEEVLPTSAETFVFSGALALESELPVYYYGDPFGSDPVGGVHQYGAAIFFHHLTTALSAPTIIVNTWEHSAADAEPFAAVTAQLPASDLETIHTEFAARNAIWDYPYRQLILDSIARYKQRHPELDEIALRVPAEGIAATPIERAPYGFGYATIEIARPESGRFDVEVTMTPSAAVPATLHATIVYGAPGTATYVPLTVSDNRGLATIDLDATADKAYLVVSTITDERLTGAPIPVAIGVAPLPALEPDPEPDPDADADPLGDPASGCCETGSSPTGPFVLTLVAGVAIGRRRRRSSSLLRGSR